MSTVSARLVTVEEFARMPDPKDGSRLELHHGEVVSVPPPKKRHSAAQDRVFRLMLGLFDTALWYTRIEFAFQPTPEFEVWVADVAVAKLERWQAVADDAWFSGAPELVVEVLSPSNTAIEINDKQRTCLDAGCLEFWVVDPQTREVRVSTPDRLARTYRAGEQVPLKLLSDRFLAVDQIFQD